MEWEASRDGQTWWPASVPGARGDDAEDWWFRTTVELPAGDEVALCFDGIATVATVTLDGEVVLESTSMFDRHVLDVTARAGTSAELVVHCHPLAPLLAQPRKPRARWRTKLTDNALRFHRTSILGRAPGFAPGPPAVGPVRPVRLEARNGLAVDALDLRPRGETLAVRAVLRPLGGRAAPASVRVEVAGHAAELDVAGGVASGTVETPGVARWWPHTHGEPVLHDVRLVVDGDLAIDAGRIGFRDLENADAESVALRINGVPVFARGALWTPVPDEQLRPALEQAAAAGLNMLRIPGTGNYESDAFFDLCDELGLLVWQDFMFANLDYPIADDAFRAQVEREAARELARIAGRPCLAVLCGNSEIEQQAAMLGLDPELGRGELFGELLPRAIREAGADVPYVPSAPSGGDLPFRTDRGVANYFGVGAYLRPLEDARRAGVRFASECLAFANVPDDDPAPGDKAGVPRDAGAGWDFEDVRDHYLALLHGVDPVALRWSDHRRYLELSRATTGEVMAEVFGEWRRLGSPCAGGLVLWLRDLAPGAGWGLVDHAGRPKAVYHHLRRALAPVAVWMTDEGLGGIAVHVANDRGEPLRAQLRIGLYRDLEQRVGEAVEDLELAAHETAERNVETMLGRFADVSWAYRFGPPAQDAVVASLEAPDGTLLSQAVRFPAGRPGAVEPAARLGLSATVRSAGDRTAVLTVASARLAYGVRVHVPGYAPADDAFCVEPGVARDVLLHALEGEPPAVAGSVSALNLDGQAPIQVAS